MGAHRRAHDAGNTVGAGRLNPERTAARFGSGGELVHVAGAGRHGVAQPNAEALGVGDRRLVETEQGAYFGPLPLRADRDLSSWKAPWTSSSGGA